MTGTVSSQTRRPLAFRAAHEREILLHQAAKKYFDGLGLKKLPIVKRLQAGYAVLLAEKKRLRQLPKGTG